MPATAPATIADAQVQQSSFRSRHYIRHYIRMLRLLAALGHGDDCLSPKLRTPAANNLRAIARPATGAMAMGANWVRRLSKGPPIAATRNWSSLIRGGIPAAGMPAFKVTDEEMRDLIAYRAVAEASR